MANEVKLETEVASTIAISSTEDWALDGPHLHNFPGPLPQICHESQNNSTFVTYVYEISHRLQRNTTKV